MRPLTLALSCLALCACGGRGTLFTAPLKPLPLVTTTAAAVTVVPQTNRAVVLRPGTPTPATLRLTPGARAALGLREAAGALHPASLSDGTGLHRGRPLGRRR